MPQRLWRVIALFLLQGIFLCTFFPLNTQAVGNESVRPLPDSNTPSFRTDSRTFLNNEDAERDARKYTTGYVHLGGLPSPLTSASCTTAAFATEAFTELGNRVQASSNGNGGAVAINYSAAIGANCLTPGNATVHVAICALVGNSAGSYQRAIGSNYFGNATGGNLTLPADCTPLFNATIVNGAVTASNDTRIPASYAMRGVYDVTDPLYGAIEGGLVDAAPAYNLARIAAPTGDVIFPKGVFLLNSGIFLKSRQGINGAGSGIIGPDVTARGVTTLISSFNGNVISVVGNESSLSIRNLTINGDRTQPLQDLVHLNSAEVPGTSSGPMRMENVDLINAGRDNLSLFGVLDSSFIHVRVNNAKRYGLRGTGGSNADTFVGCLWRASDQWGINWSGGDTASFVGGLVEANNAATGYGGAIFSTGHVSLNKLHFEANGGKPLYITGGVVHDMGSEYYEVGTITPITVDSGNYIGISPRVGPNAGVPFLTSGSTEDPIILGVVSVGNYDPILRRNGVDFSVSRLHTVAFLPRIVSSELPITLGDVSLSAGWGSTAAVSNLSGTVNAFSLRITANGIGIAANPSFSVAFSNWIDAPFASAILTTSTTSTADIVPLSVGTNGTSVGVQYIGTPTAGRVYEFMVTLRR